MMAKVGTLNTMQGRVKKGEDGGPSVIVKGIVGELYRDR